MSSKRDISALNEAAISAQLVRPIMFSRLDFSSGVKLSHTEIGPRTAFHPIYGSEVYTGIGDFGGISADITESISSSPQAVKLALTGVKSSLINDALTDDYFRRDAELMLGFDDDNGQLIDDPEIVWSGYMDKVDISLGLQTGDMQLSCESRGTQLRGASDLRFTDEDLQAVHSGDLGGEYIYRMIDLVLRWGAFNVSGSNRDGGRGARQYDRE